MLLSTPALILHTFPYSETSVITKAFTRQLGLRSYIVKGVRSRTGRVRANLLQPLSNVDMVVYDNRRTTLNHIKELAARRPEPMPSAVGNALRFFMTEVLYKSMQEDEPMPGLFDYVDRLDTSAPSPHLPIQFMVNVAHHLGIEPLDDHSPRTPHFDLEQGHFLSVPTDTTLPLSDSALLHHYLSATRAGSPPPQATLAERRRIISAFVAYYQMHLSGFHHLKSHEILHDILA